MLLDRKLLLKYFHLCFARKLKNFFKFERNFFSPFVSSLEKSLY